MAEIIGVRFKQGGKIYYFSPNEETLEVGSYAVVETARGIECGEVVLDRRHINDRELNRDIKPIIRKATESDMARMEENQRKAKRAFDICRQKIKAHGLAMNLLEAEYTFDNSKIVFKFSAEGRVDFRELVKDLASVFRARIELRQIGVRDEAKMLGGLGVCGRPFCCKQFMGDFQSVSIKMAKEQGLSLNSVKISGTCGRLMCCLKHEQDTYEELMKLLPAPGTSVSTPDGDGVVVERELVAGKVKVRLNDNPEAAPKVYRMVELEDGSYRISRSGTERFEDAAGYDLPEEPYEAEETVRKEENESGRNDSRRARGGRGGRRDSRGAGEEERNVRHGGGKPERPGDGARRNGKPSGRGGKKGEGEAPRSRPPKPINKGKKSEKHH
ncbi:MAG: stage 0 sporulation family protein [Clostridia bacterium]|nr:stage 0 sporulation family protein [Clostridia bacterium]